MSRRYWTTYEEKVLTAVYEHSTREELEQLFSTTSSRIYQKAFALGLKKSQAVISKQISEGMRAKSEQLKSEK